MKANQPVIRRVLHSIAAATLMAPLITMMPAQAAHADTNEGWNPALISSESLFDGTVVRLRYEDGITVVASVGAKVIFGGSDEKTFKTGVKRVVDRSVKVVQLPRGKSTLEDVRKYQAAGRSVYAEAVAAGFSTAEARTLAQQGTPALAEPPIYSSGCVYSEDVDPDNRYEWAGCYKLYDVTAQDPLAWYAAGSGTARGWGTGVLGGGKELNNGYSELFWNAFEGEIVEASPPSTTRGNDCRNFTIGLSRIIELSYQVPLCNDRWAVTWGRWDHRVQWEGASAGGSSDTRHASGASTVRVPIDVSTIQLEYAIGWQYSCFC